MLNAITKKKLSLVPAGETSAEIIPLTAAREEPAAVIPIHEKYLLTIREASAYFNLGVKRLHARKRETV